MNEIVSSTVSPIESGHSASLLDAVMRAASDTSTDINKLERLLAMAERLEARDAEREFGIAMSAAQEAMRPVAQDASNAQTHSKYASYMALDKAIRPVYTQHGFSLSFDTGEVQGEAVRVLCYVTHSSGHKRTYKADIPADGKGLKGGDVMTRTHAVGAAMTYGQRYLLRMIFNIAVGPDDDGNAASPKRAAPKREPPPPKPETTSPPQWSEGERIPHAPWEDESIDWPVMLPDSNQPYTTCPSATAWVGEVKEIIARVRDSKKRSDADKKKYLIGLRDANTASVNKLLPEVASTLKFTDENKES